MKHHVSQIYSSSSKPSRHIIGLMSGTSLDGLDIFYGSFEGNGFDTKVHQIAFETIPYTTALKEKIREIFAKPVVDFNKVTVYNAWLGRVHGQMINDFLDRHQISANSVDFIASHGQTVLHAPTHIHKLDDMPHATLQVADGDHIAATTGIITICDFRQKHIAHGGEGAPLAVYGDILLFADKHETRILLNLGGIANFTYIEGHDRAFVTDVGPGNTLMDAWAQKKFGIDYDHNALIAEQGQVFYPLLDVLLSDDFLALPFPKSTGPEHFNITYLENILSQWNPDLYSVYDIMTTLNMYTLTTITRAINSVTKSKETVIYASGGGAHNPMLMNGLKSHFGHDKVKLISDLGIDPDAKEAVLFAILANECIAGNSLGFANQDGLYDISMGKICFPN
jgi:anhydro-N-acetylmuramic acid kinase